ncbi:MAG: IMP dehydrogenase, partial [Nanoarchaeota archaeon]
GDMKACHDFVKTIKKDYDYIKIISGNIVTTEAARRYYDAGIDGFRVGIGIGSGYITRTVCGVGYNQLLAIKEIKERFPDIPIISDGGIRNSGDIVKVLASGADTVLVGGLLAVAQESPAERINKIAYINNSFSGSTRNEIKSFVRYYGMASKYAEEKRIKRTGEDATDIIHLQAPEGKEVYLEDSGESVKAIINRLIQGMKMGMAYLGAKDIQELRKKAKWTEI